MINDDQKTTSLDLAQIREDIDSVDQQIQQLINRRAKLAESVAKAKFAAQDIHIGFNIFGMMCKNNIRV